MVLLALTMLLVTLMVTMTIGLGLRIRQRHELQNLADAAAFSDAVATARVFNSAALANRVEVSYWVAMAGDQSLIDWTSNARALMEATRAATGNCSSDGGSNGNGDWDGFANDLDTYMTSGPLQWATYHADDIQAGQESKAIQGNIVTLREQLEVARKDLIGEGAQPSRLNLITQKVIDASGVDFVTMIPTNVSKREIAPSGAGGSGLHSYETADDWSAVMLQAALGSRGDPFITSRSNHPSMVEAAIRNFASNRNLNPPVFNAGTGSAYWGTYHSPTSSAFAWGDDHGWSVQLADNKCTATSVATDSRLKSTKLEDDSDSHVWNPRDHAVDPSPDTYHTMGLCGAACNGAQSVWVRTESFSNGGSGPEDAWGQPKLMVALQRDVSYANNKFPWELNFKFGDASWDGTADRFKNQTAYATAMVYYHHSEGSRGWLEFPNLLNPFWRATLVPADIDSSPNDVALALPSGTDASVWQALRAAGFKGVH